MTGQQFQFGYDNIGNRTNSASGGDITGANLRSVSYSVNERNQYTSIVTPGYEDILGTAIATNSVSINSGSTDRKGEYYHREIPVSNSGGPVWQSVAVSSGGSSSNGGFVFPKNSQSIGYDNDGNLTLDGIWLYRWDAENRLVEMVMTNAANIPNAQRTRLQFVYDAKGRRVSKTVSTWTGSSFGSTPVRERFVYDGWNLLAILSDAGVATRSFLWGQDLSGTIDQAGGVGGLLTVTDHQAGETHYVGFDGNGNVTTLVQTDANVTARYEYGPYGEPIRVTGVAASVNPFRWSTKAADGESGLVYYGYRYYSSTTGRWISRDPAEQRDGANLYAFVNNRPTLLIDVNGLWGVQFGSFNIGIGDPDLAFDASSWGDLGQGFFAVMDGIIPFGNPFAAHGAYDENDPTLVASRQLGTFARDLLVTSRIPNFATWAKNPPLYEIGQKALADEAYIAVKNMDALSRASSLIGSQGFLKAFVPSLNANWGNTAMQALHFDLTPGVWMLFGGVAEAADQFFFGEE